MSVVRPPTISIVIPARNEERLLPLCLTSIQTALAVVDEPFEIIVVLNRCTDRTEEIARAFGARCVVEDAKNLSIIRNAGAAIATGEFLFTCDADSQLPPTFFSRTLTTLRSGQSIGGGVPFRPDRWSIGVILTGIMLLPIALCHRIAGGAFFLRREDFIRLGGFDPNYVSAEDIDFAKRLKALGAKEGKSFSILWNVWITTSTRKLDRFGKLYFITHPGEFLRLLRGRDQKLADKIWYDFPR